MSYFWNIALFAGLPERFGTSLLTLELTESQMTAAALKTALVTLYPQHGTLISAAFVARNQSYAQDEAIVYWEDELALLPPVSGGEESSSQAAAAEADIAAKYFITTEPLCVEAVIPLVIVPEHGASLVFVGTTREWTNGKRTLKLQYEAYAPMAVRTLRQIGEEVAERWPGAECAIAHRIGIVEIAEASVIIAVSAPHRKQCYEASRYAIERLKQIVPIWKKEIWDDGTQWVGHQQENWNPIAPPAQEGSS